MTEIEIGWCAGIIDGEGCITLCKDGKKQSIRSEVTVNMTHEATVRRLHGLFRHGTVYFCPNTKAKYKPTWRWRVCNLQAVAIVMQLQPYLFTKNEQAKLLIEFAEKCWLPNTGGQAVSEEVKILREVLYMEMRELNKRGTDA